MAPNVIATTAIVDSPLLVFILSLIALTIAAHAGGLFSEALRDASPEARNAFGVVEAATLTLSD